MDVHDIDRFANGDLVAVGADGAVMTSAGGGMPWALRGVLTPDDLEAVRQVAAGAAASRVVRLALPLRVLPGEPLA